MSDRAAILLVDDSPDKLLALTVVLEGLAEEIVTARSGREALRVVLSREFAVILLDVRMPDMDGFETAQLIRSRQSSEHTPIIFVTAFADEEFSSRGYELGAVDFITAPIRPEVLRSKVAVFLDLFKKTRQVSRQAEALKRQTEQLHQLSQASLAINAALSLIEMLDVAAGFARDLVDADEAVTQAFLDTGATARLPAAVAVRQGSDADRRSVLEEAALFTSLLETPGKTVNATSDQLAEGARWAALRRSVDPERARRSRLWVPLLGRDGRKMGWLCAVAGARDFSAEDESILSQLAQVTSVALENALYREAREANRLKDEFLTTLSHELRTPLTAILGWVQLLKAQSAPGERLSHALAVIERNVTAQSRLIEDLLDVSRVIAGKLRLEPGEVQPVSVVEAAMDSLAPTAAAKGVAMDLAIDPAVSAAGPMGGDSDRLQQVVWNLLSNALKFTPNGGRVQVTVERSDGQLRLGVADNGLGISPAFIEHVFDRFRQADSSTTRSQGGLGIGLTLVRHIVELHGGTVTAESPGVGKGSTFSVLLPITPAPQRSAAAVAPSPETRGEKTSLHGLHILVVDDEPDAREVLSEVLQGAGATAETASSASEAMEKLLERSFDLLISDIGMPVVDGLSLIRMVRSSPAARIPAIALTAYAREEDRQAALTAGFNLHLGKPVEPATFITAALETVRTPGGRVELDLPSALGRGAPIVEPPPAPAGNGRRVLIVEDDADGRDALKWLLELDGYSVDVAGSGPEGVEKALSGRPEVVLVDIGLPEMDGREVARRIRASTESGSMYLIAVTGYTGSVARTEALQAGFDAHVTKPIDLERLQTLLAKGVGNVAPPRSAA